MNVKLGNITLRPIIPVLLTILAASSLAKSIYVDSVNGRDENPGTQAAPIKSLARAQTHADFGDTIFLADGQYGLFTKNMATPYPPNEPDQLSPNDPRWITFKALPDSRPQIGQMSFTAETGRWLLAYRVSGIDIIGGGIDLKRIVGFDMNDCTVTGSGDKIENAVGGAIAVILSSDVTFDNCRFRFRKKTCLTISSSSYITLNRSTIHDVGADHITLRTGYADCNHIYITNNTIANSLRWNKKAHNDAVQFYADKGNGFYNCVFSGNIIRDMAVQGLFIHSSGSGKVKNCLVENNLFYRCNRVAVSIANTTDTVFRNNTVIGYVNISAGNKGLSAYNNIIAGSFNVKDPASLGYHDYNIYVRARKDRLGRSEPNSFIYAAKAQAKLRRDLFIDPGKDDYRLRSTSRAIDFCPAEPTPKKDLLNNPRDDSPDAGCYESIKTAVITEPNSL